MNTIKCVCEYTLEVKKSKFIGIITPVNDLNDALDKLAEIKNKYPNARHYAYAYIIDDTIKESDDKEPSKTAGAPILSVLKNHDLNHVLCVVVRYFGGILLGTGLLTRSYKDAALGSFKISEVIPYIEYTEYTLTFSYENVKQIDFLLKEEQIISKEFNEDITYRVMLPKSFDITSLEKYSKIV